MSRWRRDCVISYFYCRAYRAEGSYQRDNHYPDCHSLFDGIDLIFMNGEPSARELRCAIGKANSRSAAAGLTTRQSKVLGI